MCRRLANHTTLRVGLWFGRCWRCVRRLGLELSAGITAGPATSGRRENFLNPPGIFPWTLAAADH